MENYKKQCTDVLTKQKEIIEMKFKKGEYLDSDLHEFYKDLDEFKKNFRDQTKDIVYEAKESLLADEIEKFMRKVFEEI